MATPIYHAGILGTATFNNQELSVIQWTITPTVQLVEFKNSKSGPLILRLATFQDATGTIGFDFDFANNPFATPPNITVGSIITNVKFYLNQTTKGALDGKWVAPPSLIIESTPISLNVEGEIVTTMSWKCAGDPALGVTAAPATTLPVTYPA